MPMGRSYIVCFEPLRFVSSLTILTILKCLWGEVLHHSEEIYFNILKNNISFSHLDFKNIISFIHLERNQLPANADNGGAVSLHFSTNRSSISENRWLSNHFKILDSLPFFIKVSIRNDLQAKNWWRRYASLQCYGCLQIVRRRPDLLRIRAQSRFSS